MIDISKITIGSLLKTNRGEIIKVESISTKHQHRKLGYHKADDPYHIHYVRLAQCEPIPLSPEFMFLNHWFRLHSECEYDLVYGYIQDTMHDSRWVLTYETHGGTPTLTIEEDILPIDERHTKLVLHNEVFSIHELQFALNVCGLSEIAKNVKVV